MILNSSLKTKLTLLNAAIVAFMTAGSAVLIGNLIKHETELIQANVWQNANDLGDAVQDQFFERYGDVKAFAAVFGIDPKMTVEQRTELLNKDVELYGIYDLILYSGVDGKTLAVNTKDAAGNDIDVSSILKLDHSVTPWFQAASKAIYNEDTAKGLVGVALEPPHFDPLVEAVYRKPAWGTSFTAPVVAKSGEVLGYVSTRAGFRWVEDVVKRSYTNAKKKGLHTAGYLLFGTDGRLFLNYLPEQNDGNLDFNRDKSVMQNANVNALEEYASVGLTAGKSGLVTYKEPETGDSRILTFAPIKGNKFIDGYWNLAVSFDEVEAFAGMNGLVKSFVVLTSVASLLALILGLMFGNKLSKSLKELVDRLFQQGLDVRKASEEVSSTSDQLSSAASQQAAALQETVAAVNEISAMVGRTADMATQSRNTSQSSRNVANDGKRTVDEMIHSMDEIRESNKEILTQVEDGNKEISQIVRVISEIGNKTKVINDIVFQTKLLSFNASVEAARAGEHGKGFAVVAEEVGNLAQMSGAAAKEISDLLEQSVVKVQTIVDQTGQRVERLVVNAREKVANGEETARRCAQILEQILLNADEVNALINEIATSAQEQARGVQEINSAMTELDSVTQQNSASASQSSQLSSSLLTQSEGLSDLVSALNNVVSGNSEMKSDGQLISRPNNRDSQKNFNTPVSRFSNRLGSQKRDSGNENAHVAGSNSNSNVRNLKVANETRTNKESASRRSSFDGNAAMRTSEVPDAEDQRFED